MTAPVSVQKCLEAVLDRTLAKRYIRNVGMGTMPARYYYNNALRDLNSKDSEGAIHHLIIALNTEIDHEASLHLVKTMLFGLSKKFNDAGGDTYKQKYAGIPNWIISIEKNIQENEKQLVSLKNEQSKQVNLGLWGVIQKLFFKATVKNYDELINQLLLKKEEAKKQLILASKIAQIGEYAKVLSLLLEICLYPARYAWIVA
jgi:hypothetical protein